ncbi:AMP-binding protein [Pseudoalteromonas sp. T1lg75]|uniref:AMP-binding protein n=1 Tax=Pseudoalteromonas sp. T1lg75 TaxID=2077102 RepID=UPI000CF5F0AC|nr:AMP-binding protein [Pseudoalteromonas sp. T1lg75]
MLAQIQEYQNLDQFISSACQRYGDQDAFTSVGKTLTFAQIDTLAEQLAGYFYGQGLRAGDRIAIQLPNVNQYPIVVYAAFKLGLVVVNTNPLYTPREMLHQFNDSGAKALVILADLYPKLAGIIADTEIEHLVCTGAADLLLDSSEAVSERGVSWHQALAEGQGQDFPRSSAHLEDVAVLQYTGGTTGVSKGAQLTHKNLIANALQTKEAFGDRYHDASEIFICPLPLYHIYAFTLSILINTASGNHSVLIPNPRDLDAFVNAIKPFRFTSFAGINTLFVGLCATKAFTELDFSRLRLTVSGGAALTTTAANAWAKTTGCSISEGYGLSETSPVVTLNQPGGEQIGTVGFPVRDTEVELWDEHDCAVADGDSGQIVVRGPQVMKGYWNRPEESAKALTADGFFKTGDVGIRLDNGAIKVVDRLKDMIIVSGFNVYPNEVEDVLVSHPAVFEAAVVGKADERSGEAVHAYITVKQAVDEKELQEFCRQQLTNYKVPKHIHILDELPKSTVGKILRRELRDDKA